MAEHREAELVAIRDAHESWLKSLPGVVGTGVGLDPGGRLSLKIYSNRISPETRDRIRTRLGDIPVTIEETGEIRKQ